MVNFLGSDVLEGIIGKILSILGSGVWLFLVATATHEILYGLAVYDSFQEEVTEVLTVYVPMGARDLLEQ